MKFVNSYNTNLRDRDRFVFSLYFEYAQSYHLIYGSLASLPLFILWIYWLLMMKLDSSNYLETTGLHQKFGSIKRDGTIKVPNCLTLKWVPNYFFRLNEGNSVLIMYLITLTFCFLGLIIY